MPQFKHPWRIIFFGTAGFSVPSLEQLLSSGYHVVAVITKPDSGSGRSKTPTPPAVKVAAQKYDIPVLQPHSLNDIHDQIKELNPDVGAVVSYGKIIPQSTTNLFPLGLINVHASLLPKYRGASPIEAAILNGDRQTGVTLMKIDAGLDTGPIYTTAEITLKGTEAKPQLYRELSELGGQLLADDLPAIMSGQLAPTPQSDSQASTVGIIKKSDGEIDWHKSAEQIERQIRAYLDWPGSRTNIMGREVIITKAHAVPTNHPGVQPGEAETINDAGILMVECGHGTLCVDRLKPAGKKEMTAGDFLRGLR